MSYMQRPYANGNTNGNGNTHGIHSYTNGSTNQQRLARFDFDTTPDTSADERSRSRGPGLGGFSNQINPHSRAPPHLEREQAHRRSRDYGYGYDGSSRSRSRGAPAAATARYGSRGNEVEEILRYISQHWSFMASDNCIPIKVALQLMDPSSLGLADQYDQFQEVHQHLQNALKVIVNEHHQGFNSSIGTFHKIQAAIHASQHRVRTLRAGLLQSKASLSTARPELRAYATSSQGYDRMLQVIADIEQLQSIPDMLDAQISEKRFLGAVDTLQEGLALIRKPEMEDIGALSELKLRLSNQEQFLSDHLIEELHNHLYLKSPYCEERWKAHFDQDADSNNALSSERAMYVFLESYDGREPMQEDPTRNPEADSFYYIQVLVESLNRMGRLDAAVDEIERRLPVELFKVVERSHGEVEQRHPATMRSAAAAARQQAGRRVGAGIDSEQKFTLQDLLTTLYAKFEAIAEGHRVLHDVTGAILKREAQSDVATLNRSFRELWKLLQSEIRSLLHDHLTITGAGMGGQRHKDNDLNANMFRLQPRDKTKKLFKISAADASRASDTNKSNPATDVLATEKEDLLNMLKDSVPGLVNTSQAQQAHKQREAELAMADKSATGHKLLVEPSLFNMSILLPPSLSFLHRLRDIVPPASSSGVVANTSTSFLDDFLINVFYPQLDETLTELCAENNSSAGSLSSEAFQPDPKWREYSSRPVFRGAVRFYEVLEMVCGMLDALPHEQSFSLLVVREMRGWYERCFGWSKGLLQRVVSGAAGADVQMGIRLAAELATSGEVNEVVIEFLKVEEKERVVLAEKESALLLQVVKERGVEEADLIRDRKALAALCTLHVSMKWLAARCQGLRWISPRAIDMGGGHHSPADAQHQHQHHHNHHVRRWTSSSAQQPGGLPNEPSGAYLPLDPQTATQFDAVLSSFTELSTLILRTLHVDLRLHLLHGVSQALSHSYELGVQTPGPNNHHHNNTPDPSILDLSQALSSYDAVISAGLLPPQYTFLTRDLHVLGNNAFTSASTLTIIKGSTDDAGLARMQLNLLVLQQAIKNLDAEGSLAKAAGFWALGEQGCEAIVTRGRKDGFGAEELGVLVGLCWREGRDERGGVELYVGILMAEGAGAGGGGGAAFPRRKASLRRGKSGGG
ncbi:hypothetical protein B0A55_06448 [Friedmanniomyces simplex]|uniref:Exocyst complex component Sec8 n=1 Tax=Friedmanniomyces simplex TaxID=329884 RepID=A0A4U0XF12_9PEZI|nr:hypothetical protein B0A55_06448 [Friedmanniomyces simplex]